MHVSSDLLDSILPWEIRFRMHCGAMQRFSDDGLSLTEFLLHLRLARQLLWKEHRAVDRIREPAMPPAQHDRT